MFPFITETSRPKGPSPTADEAVCSCKGRVYGKLTDSYGRCARKSVEIVAVWQGVEAAPPDLTMTNYKE